MTEQKELKIVRLQASNVMNLEVIEIVPDGDTVILSGKNGAGKTNVLNSIEFALSGKALKAMPEPVRHGQTSGDIVLDLGDIVVKRHFTNDSSSLIVTNNKGMIFKSPQALLDGFRGNVSFDPMEFEGLPEKRQKEVLLELIDLPIDLDELAAKRKELYDARTVVNRDVKKLEGQLAGIPDMPDVPDDEISAVDVMAEQQEAMELIASNKQIRDKLLNEKSAMEELRIREIELKTELKRIQDTIDLKIDVIALSEQTVSELVVPDLESFKCRLEDVEVINAKVRKKQERNRIQKELTDTRGESLRMTVDITAIDELKTTTIQEANMPVPGLGFDETGVTFEDLPLSQQSSGEQRKISAAIGMAMNPNLRVLWIKDASLLDTESMDDIKAMAKEHGYQVWFELVGDNGNVGIHIKEGRVVS